MVENININYVNKINFIRFKDWNLFITKKNIYLDKINNTYLKWKNINNYLSYINL